MVQTKEIELLKKLQESTDEARNFMVDVLCSSVLQKLDLLLIDIMENSVKKHNIENYNEIRKCLIIKLQERIKELGRK